MLLPCETFDIAKGIRLRNIFADIFTTPMMAYSSPDPGTHHPAPWSAVAGGSFFECRTELEISTLESCMGFSTKTVAWLIVAIMRLHLDGPIRLAALSNKPFQKEHASASGGFLFEAAPVQWGIFNPNQRAVPTTASNLAWFARELPLTLSLWPDERFQRAFAIFDEARWSANDASAVTMLWTAVEILLGVSASRDKGRVISAKLSGLIGKDPGEQEKVLPVIRDLYQKRGSIVHAGGKMAMRDFIQLFRFVSVAFQRTIVGGHLP